MSPKKQTLSISDDYTIPENIRAHLKIPNHILFAPISEFFNLENHINYLPSHIILRNQASVVYTDIKDTLFALMNLKEPHIALSNDVCVCIKKLYSFFCLQKSKKQFTKLYNEELNVQKQRQKEQDNKNKILAARKRTYEEAQLLGNDLTSQSIREFRTDFIIEHCLNDNSETPSTSTIANISSSTMTSSTTTIQQIDQIHKETCLEKNKKKFTIYNPAAYLTTPHKSKMQVIDQDKLKDICTIGMEFLEELPLTGVEEMDEYHSNAIDQNDLKSLCQFPSMIEYIRDCLDSDIDTLPVTAWTHIIHTTSTGLTKMFAKVVALSLTDFTSNCKQAPILMGNHERNRFNQYIVPAFKYLSQENGFSIMSWCEKQVQSQVDAGLQQHDYFSDLIEQKYSDGLGVNAKTNNEEFFIESSSSLNKENVSHTLDDTIKMIVECSNSLNYVIKKNKNASIDTICQKGIYGLQILCKH